MSSHVYRLHGITLESEIPFPGLVPCLGRKAHPGRRVLFRKRKLRPLLPLGEGVPSNRVLCRVDPGGRSAQISSSHAGHFRVDFLKSAVDWDPAGRVSMDLVGVIVRGRVLGFLLPYLNSCLALHASVPIIGGEAVGLVGASGIGKSTLAAAFLKRGFRLLSDDLAVVQRKEGRFLIQPGPSEVRLWPRSADRLRMKKRQGAPVYPETRKRKFLLNPGCRGEAQKPKPLKALYILSREPKSPLGVEELQGPEALAELFRGAYGPSPEDREILGRQFEMAAELVREIPVKRLTYPSGFSHLPRVCRGILSDLGCSISFAKRFAS